MKMKTLIKDLKEETISLDDVSDEHIYGLISHFLNQCNVDKETDELICLLDNWLIDTHAVMFEFEEYFSTPVRKEDYGIVNN